MRLVFVGEVMVEMAPDGATYRQGFAGDTFNMAWYARKMCPAHWTVDFVTAIGTDAISTQLLTFMADANVGTAHVQHRTDRTVGLYLISLLNGERSFAYWRSHSAARCLADDRTVLDRAFGTADLVCLSGITLAVLEGAGRDNLAEALSAFRARGGRVAFDPNIRPQLWESPQKMRETIIRFAALSDIVLASFDDEAAHFDDDSSSGTCARYLGAGARCVVVKNGPGPIQVALANTEITVTPQPVAQVIDSTAAGDSFNANFLVHLLKGGDLRQAVASGIALSREVIGHPGALSYQAVLATRNSLVEQSP